MLKQSTGSNNLHTQTMCLITESYFSPKTTGLRTSVPINCPALEQVLLSINENSAPIVRF